MSFRGAAILNLQDVPAGLHDRMTACKHASMPGCQQADRRCQPADWLAVLEEDRFRRWFVRLRRAINSSFVRND